LIGGDLTSATTFLGASLALVCVVALIIATVGLLMIRGREMAVPAALLLFACAGVTAWVYLADVTDAARSALSVPGAGPVISIAQLSWLVLACSALALLAGSVLPQPESGVRGAPFVLLAACVIVTVIVPIAVGGAAVARASDETSVQAVPIPAVPTTVGSQVAYRLESADPMQVIPAGPGFVTNDGDRVTAYDGGTGARRWTTSADVRDNCSSNGVRSTGTTPTSVVLIGCTEYFEDDVTYSYITGVDAMTGEHLWTNAENWTVRARAVTTGAAVAVLRNPYGDTEIGSLDARTGAILWSRSAPSCFDPVGMATADHSVVVVESCQERGRVAVHVFEATTGNERRVRLAVSPDLVAAQRLHAEIFAVNDDFVAIQMWPDDEYSRESAVIVNAANATYRSHPGDVSAPSTSDLQDDRYPGPLTQLVDSSYPDYVELLMMPGGQTRRISDVRMTVIDDDVADDQLWAEIGDQVATAASFDENYELVVVSGDTIVERRSSPCGDETAGGITAVPGSVVLVCYPGRRDEPRRRGVEILGLR
jgi:hypothetical protein